ncbi:MAG: hypothetical protein WCY13_02965 [Candidatus Cloacimonadaceae bacterium]
MRSKLFFELIPSVAAAKKHDLRHLRHYPTMQRIELPPNAKGSI